MRSVKKVVLRVENVVMPFESVAMADAVVGACDANVGASVEKHVANHDRTGVHVQTPQCVVARAAGPPQLTGVPDDLTAVDRAVATVEPLARRGRRCKRHAR